MVTALEWAEIRALERDGVSQRQIAARLGINRRTSRGRWVRTSRRGMCDPGGVSAGPVDGVIGQVLEQWPDIKGTQSGTCRFSDVCQRDSHVVAVDRIIRLSVRGSGALST